MNMYKKFWNMWLKWKTKNFTQIPIIYIMFDWQKFQKYGKAGSCDFYAHPNLTKDEVLTEKLKDCVDYIRNNYDMETFTRI